MYRKEQLEKYQYFAEILQEDPDVSVLLDQLTGLVSRGHILWFAKWLIEHQVPFSFAMIDLDNFKFINDTYGHHAGDQVLVHVADDLAAALDGIGLAGRFGGDEMLIVNLRDTTYDACKAFFADIYDGKVLRKNIELTHCNPFITATVGCAIFPKDAQTYDGLFDLIDKLLYRGKNKGRNCHIIYVEEKHKDIVIHRIARQGMYTTFSRMVRLFEMAPGLKNKLRSVMPLLMEELQVSELYYADRNGRMRAVRDDSVDEMLPDLEKLLQSDDMFADNSLEKVEQRSPVTYQVMKARRSKRSVWSGLVWI